MKELITVLQAFGELAHWTVRPAPEKGNPACPTIITWRYRQPSAEALEFFCRVVGAYRGAVAWEFSSDGPTWTLMPARIKEFAAAHQLVGGLAAAEKLMTIDPEFGILANADIRALVQHLERQLSARAKRLPQSILAAG